MNATSGFGSLEQIQDTLKFLGGTILNSMRKVVYMISDILQKRHQTMSSSTDELEKNMF